MNLEAAAARKAAKDKSNNNEAVTTIRGLAPETKAALAQASQAGLRKAAFVDAAVSLLLLEMMRHGKFDNGLKSAFLSAHQRGDLSHQKLIDSLADSTAGMRTKIKRKPVDIDELYRLMASTSKPRRGRGRPKGSKNKAKGAVAEIAARDK